MATIYSKNYLLVLDLFCRIILSVLLPRVFNPEMLANYNNFLILIFWIMILDFGLSQGFALRLIRKYDQYSVNINYIFQSLVFSLILGFGFFLIFFLIFNKDLQFDFVEFFMTFFFVLVYSYFSTIFKSFGLFEVDSISRIIVSVLLILLIVGNNNFPPYVYILFPYMSGLIYMSSVFFTRVRFSSRRFKSFSRVAAYNVKLGLSLYIINSLLLIYPLMDKVVFSKLLSIENYGNYLFSYMLSSLHILIQNQITSKYYRQLLSDKEIDNKSKLRILLVSILIHIILFLLILFLVSTKGFKSFYANYTHVSDFILLTEFICMTISILSVCYLVLNSGRVRIAFLVLSYFIPLVTFILYKFNLLNDLFYWILVYLLEFLITGFFLFKFNPSFFRFKN